MKNKFIIIFVCIFSLNLGATENEVVDSNIFKNLRCIICQGQSIAESNSDFAQTIKIVVRDQINQGSNEEEIYEFLVEKYGEWIVYKPLFNAHNFLLWALPYLIFIAGGVFIFFIVKKSKQFRDN
jgi:cytochrome c-type biogenesis protein CcmH